MRQFIISVSLFFAVLFLIYVFRDNGKSLNEASQIRIYASGSFISEWGPGPELKKAFEKKTDLKILFLEMSDPALTLQKLNLNSDMVRADLVLGLDQFDLIRVSDKVKWRNISDYIVLGQTLTSLNKAFLEHEDFLKSDFKNHFIPYDWSAIAFVKKATTTIDIKSLEDLLNPEIKSKIAFEDPRTSSPGLQFLMWVARSFPEDKAISYLQKINDQAHSFSPSWSTAYGLFKNKNADLVLSYVTSPIYHLIEEKDSSYHALNFAAGLPLQIEFVGLLDQCLNCEGALKFLSFIQSHEAQQIIMNKNYMLPIDKNVVESTAFDTIPVYNFLNYKAYTKEEINKWLKIWSEIRKNEG
jgi:thiamine transport system substrate-binding protein